MPLLKKKPFSLVADPQDLSPDEQVWQIRFTHEIFRDYSEYLGRLNLFRQRVWTCNITGKMHLTYEEALVSERQANERLQQFPENYKAFVLQIVQFSILKLTELVTMIFEKLGDTFVQGEELLGTLADSNCPCKIMKVVDHKGGPLYEVGWLGDNKEVNHTSIVDKKNLIRKKFPFSRDLLKLFIKESTFQNNPWVIHNNLVKLYGLPTKPPRGLEGKITKHPEVNDASTAKRIMEKIPTDQAHAQQLKVEEIMYPIEDLLVKPSTDDPVFSVHPAPSVNFLIPIDDVGNLLMIWDFLSCFGKILHLSPFSLNVFEEAIAYDGVSNLIAEVHVALLMLLINEHDEYNSVIQEKKRKETISMDTWVQYLCDFLELMSNTKLTNLVLKIKNGKYNGLSVHDKLEILGELMHWALLTDSIKGKVDKCIEKQHALMANKREEDREEFRKKREEKRLKNETSNQPTSDSMHTMVDNDLQSGGNMKDLSSFETEHQGNRGSKLEVLTSRRALMKKFLALKEEKEISRMKEHQSLREESRAKASEARKRRLKQKRSELYELEMEKLHIWTNSLGKDRDHNTYWFFQRDGRIFVESADHNQWGFYSSKDELDALVSSLNPKGERELALRRNLEKYYTKICSAFHKRSKVMVVRVGLKDTAILRRSVRVSAIPRDDRNTPSFLKYDNTKK